MPLSERDEEAFKFLQRIEFTLAENDSDFFLKFHFAENPFFKQTVLEKKFYYEEDELVKVDGTKVEWHDGKNLTKKVIKKVNLIIYNNRNKEIRRQDNLEQSPRKLMTKAFSISLDQLIFQIKKNLINYQKKKYNKIFIIIVNYNLRLFGC